MMLGSELGEISDWSVSTDYDMQAILQTYASALGDTRYIAPAASVDSPNCENKNQLSLEQ
jgi:hypothetical protein